MTSYKQLESFQKVYLDARDSYPTGSPMHDPVVAFEDRGPYGGLMWRQYSNCGSLYVISKGQRFFVRDFDIPQER